MLLKLVASGAGGIRHSVISLQTQGTVGPKLEKAGASVVALDLPGGRIPGIAAWKLVTQLRKLKPDVVQGWMYHGNVAATAAHAALSRKPALCWSIRCSLGEGVPEKWLTRAVIMLGRVLSHRPETVIYNSDRSRLQHQAIGYSVGNSIVIPNGFDVKKYCPSTRLRESMRRRLGLPADGIVVGLLARLHPMKDHRGYIASATEIMQRFQNTYFIAAGRDVTHLATNEPCLVQKAGERLVLLPEQADVVEFMNGLDICVLSSSWGEGFPNVLGEAMSCGVPCIATDVGDCASIIDGTGTIVPPRSLETLSAAVLEMIAAGPQHRREIGVLARQRIIAKYSIENVTTQYETQWAKAAASTGRLTQSQS